MSVRHKAIVAPLQKGLSTEWNDDHEADFTDEIEESFKFTTRALTNEWSTAETSGGSAPVVIFEDSHAWAKLNTGATTNQSSVMKTLIAGSAGNLTDIDDAPILNCAVKLEAYHTAGKVIEFGFLNSSVNIFTALQDGAYFRVLNQKLYAITGSGAAETATELTGVTLAQLDFLNCRIELTSTICNFYVDDLETAAAIHTTNLPDSALTVKFGIISANNINSTMFVDACALARLRVTA